jgi:hypothetical protein
MLRLTLTDKDMVLACMPVGTARHVVVGSIQVPCMECDRMVWKAPGKPLVRWDESLTKLVPNTLGLEPNIILCIPCTRLHQNHQGMK